MESQLIRILPACLTEPLPRGWDASTPEYIFEVMPAVDAPEAINYALPTTEPDILLFDADAPGDVFAAVQNALSARENLAVVMISSDNSPERLRKAMFAGAEEYLIKPLEAATLRESILGIAQHKTLRVVRADGEDYAPEELSNGLVVGVLSGKGGLGKTTLAVNMASVVAEAPNKTAGVLALESGDGAVLLNLQPKLGLLDLAGGNEERREEGGYQTDWLKQFATRHKTGLNYWQWQGSGTNPPDAIPEDFLQALFQTCRRSQSVTFVDFGSLTADEASMVFPILDVILIVTSSSDLLALRATKTLVDLIPEEFEPRVRIIVNRSDPSDMINRGDFESALERKIAALLPNQPQVASQAINMGSPFVLTQPNSELSLTVKQLTQVLFRLPTGQSAKGKKRFLLF